MTGEPTQKYNMFDVIIFIVVAFFIVFIGTRFWNYQGENSLDKLIPPSAVKGGITNFIVSGIKVSEGKSRNGGTLVTGSVVVPYNIKRDQVKPTLLAAIKGLKDKYRKCEWIIVYAIPSQELEGSGINAGMAEYAEGKIRIDYGIPSSDQIAESVGRGLKKLSGADYEPVRLMSREDFDSAVAIDAVWQKIHLKLLDDANQKARQNMTRYADIYRRETAEISDTKLAALTSQKMSIPASQIKKLRRQLLMYYGPFWGNETLM